MALASLHTARTVKVLAVVIAMALLGLGIINAFAVAPDTPYFERTWARTDKPVTDGEANRTWMWGPEANTGPIPEPYIESPDGERIVQYFDKSRMEITHPDAVDDGVWYVTNGLLVNELVSGKIQIGDAAFEDREPAEVNVAGDPDDPNSPTYATIGMVLDAPPSTDGAPITQRLARDGTITNDPSLEDEDVTAAYHVQVTDIDHQVASPFWEFMTSSGTVYEDGEFVEDLLFQNAFYATGYPIAEAYWAAVKVQGTVQDVLIQCFERRCLTYTPGNDPGWQVEAGNVGMHYYAWRYPDIEPPTATSTPTATATSTPTNTPTATATATATQPPVEEHLLIATLSGVTDAVTGTGVTYFYVRADGTGIDYQIVVTDLVNVTAAHIHAGSAGEMGEILVPLFVANDGTSVTPDGVLAEGTIAADDLPEGLTLADLVDQMVQGETYVNVHTTARPAGAIRGQIQLLKTANLRAALSGESQIPPVETDASGAALFNYDATLNSVAFQVALNGVEGLTAVRIHEGAVNENGPIVATLFVAPSPIPFYNDVLTGLIIPESVEGVTMDELVYMMLTGNAYLNVQTSFYPNGELRGQIMASSVS